MSAAPFNDNQITRNPLMVINAMFRKIPRTLWLILLALLAMPLDVGAQNSQTPSELLVNYFETVEGEESLRLDLYFTVLDENGKVIPDASVDSADILVDGERTAATVIKPTTPLLIAITLDASGSMAEQAEDMRQAAIEAVQNAPDEAQFAIIKFNEEITPAPFTSNKDQAIATISALNIDNKGTCLYDAAYRSVELVNEAAGSVPVARRAVILFTDGRDERTAGQGDTCSTRTFEEVVELASRRASPVPIHTIGLGNVDPRLPEMSTLTGWLNTSGAEGDLRTAFRDIMDGLRGQLLASAELFPRSGQKSATIEANMRDNILLTESIIFNVSRDYDPPAQPITIQRTNLTYREDSNSFAFDVTVDDDAAQVVAYQLIVVGEDGTQVADYEFSGTPPFIFSADGLTAGADFTIEVYALNEDGILLETERGDALLSEAEFTYLPPATPVPPTPTPPPTPSITVRPIDINVTERTMTIVSVLENPEQVANFEVEVVAADTGDLVDSFSADSATLQNFNYPLTDLADGKYTVIVNAFDQSGAIIASSEQAITYNAPTPPGFWQRVTTGFQTNPLIPIAIVGLIVLLIGFFMLRALLERRNTGTPFLQGEGLRSGGASALPVNQTIDLDASTVQEAVKSAGGQTLLDPRTGGAMPKLTLRVPKTMDQSKLGQEFSVSHYPFTIGREGCDLSFSNDPHMSRRHAEITFRDGNFYITDLNSSNGIYIGENRIPPQVPMPLPPAREVGLGKSTRIIVMRG